MRAKKENDTDDYEDDSMNTDENRGEAEGKRDRRRGGGRRRKGLTRREDVYEKLYQQYYEVRG